MSVSEFSRAYGNSPAIQDCEAFGEQSDTAMLIEKLLASGILVDYALQTKKIHIMDKRKIKNLR